MLHDLHSIIPFEETVVSEENLSGGDTNLECYIFHTEVKLI